MQAIIHTWEAHQERNGGVQSMRTWQERQPNTIGDLHILKGTAVFFLSSAFKGTLRCCRNVTSTCIPVSAGTGVRSEELDDSPTWTRVASRQRSWLKFPGPRMQGDVRRAGGVGLICMSGRLLHLQIGSHWACLSAPLAALLAYGATEGIHEHSRGVGLSTHWYNLLFLWLLTLVRWQLVPFGGFGFVQSSYGNMIVEESLYLLYFLLILYKQAGNIKREMTEMGFGTHRREDVMSLYAISAGDSVDMKKQEQSYSRFWRRKMWV